MKRLSFTNNRLRYNTKSDTVYFIVDEKTLSSMKLNTSRNGKTLILYMGTTIAPYRRKGIGQYLRAHILKAAKNAGYNFVEQNSVNLATGNNTKKPPSAYIMNKLGGVRSNGNAYHYTFNLRGNLPKGTRNSLNKKPRI